MAANGSETLEVRLALVCYGGVSLAIYMSGITREIQELVTASALRLEPDAGAPSGTAAVYARLIEALETDASRARRSPPDPGRRRHRRRDVRRRDQRHLPRPRPRRRLLAGGDPQLLDREGGLRDAPRPEGGGAPGQGAGRVEPARDRAATRQAPRPRSGAPVLVRPVGGREVGTPRGRGPPAQDAGHRIREGPPAKRPPRRSHVLAHMGRPERDAEAHASCRGAVPLRRERDRPGGDVHRVRRALRRRPALARARLRRGAPPRLPHPRSGRRIARPRRRDARVRRARDGVVPGRVRAGQPRSLPTADQGCGREGGLGRHRPPLPAPVPGRREGHRPPLRRRRRARQHAVRRGDRRHPAAQVPGRGAPRARVRGAVTHGRRLDPASRPPGPRRSRGQRRHGDVQERLDDPAVADDGRPDRQSAREERPRAGAPVGDRAAVRRRREAR